jgi:DNA-binding MarR family transcriptional regulator
LEDVRDADLLQELYSTGLLVGLLVDEELERAGVPLALFSFLGWIARLQPVTPGLLAAETGLPATTIRDYVRRLRERGDVRKIPNPKDGRSYHLVLTPKGQNLADRGWPAVLAAYNRVARYLERPPGEHLIASRELRTAVKQALTETQGRPSSEGRSRPGDSERRPSRNAGNPARAGRISK